MDEDVFILEISVHDVLRVQVPKPVKDLQAYRPHDAFIQGRDIRELLQVGECSTIAVLEE